MNHNAQYTSCKHVHAMKTPLLPIFKSKTEGLEGSHFSNFCSEHKLCTHSLCFEQKKENYHNVFTKILIFSTKF